MLLEMCTMSMILSNPQIMLPCPAGIPHVHGHLSHVMGDIYHVLRDFTIPWGAILPNPIIHVPVQGDMYHVYKYF
jgi:hypothetical protein